MEIGTKFKTVLYTDLCNDITKAFNSLTIELYKMDDNSACIMLEEMTKEMKKVLNCYIEQQKSTFCKIRTVC